MSQTHSTARSAQQQQREAHFSGQCSYDYKSTKLAHAKFFAGKPVTQIVELCAKFWRTDRTSLERQPGELNHCDWPIPDWAQAAAAPCFLRAESASGTSAPSNTSLQRAHLFLSMESPTSYLDLEPESEEAAEQVKLWDIQICQKMCSRHGFRGTIPILFLLRPTSWRSYVVP